MNIARALQYARPGEKWTVVGDLGSYTGLVWHDTTDKPTETELTAADLSAAKSDRIAVIKREAAQRILSQWPAWKQDNCALGLYDSLGSGDPDYPATILAGISGVRTASNAAEAAVTALADVAEVDAFTW